LLALLPPGGSVLDLGCGSGEPIAGHLIGRGHSVTGIDSSPAMVDLCRQPFPDQTWLVADMRGLSLDRAFAGILAWDSFFHLAHDDQRRMFPVFGRRAARGRSLDGPGRTLPPCAS
jgi:trans-aconitate methyltransferase